MIVSWREATSQNTAHTQTNTFLTGKQTHTHSLTLSRTLTYEHHYHASPGISILSFPSSVNRTCPIQILHSTPTLLSTEHLSANTINGISENSRTCQIIESDIEQLLSLHYLKFHMHHALWALGGAQELHSVVDYILKSIWRVFFSLSVAMTSSPRQCISSIVKAQ